MPKKYVVVITLHLGFSNSKINDYSDGNDGGNSKGNVNSYREMW